MSIIQMPIVKSLKEEFQPYAEDVIINNLPMIDGLLLAHKKVLWGMYKKGTLPNKSFVKNIKNQGSIVEYYVYGDMPLAKVMVNMANNGMSIPFLEWDGNSGDKYRKDGKPASARYTGSKLSNYGLFMLQGIEKNAVPMKPNFDNTSIEPIVSPSIAPNILFNNSESIAISEASKIPPHNVNDVCDSISNYIKNKNIEKSIEILKCPDFQCIGGKVIYDKKTFDNIYYTGKGSFTLLGSYNFDKETNIISIYEVPYVTTINAIEDAVISNVEKGKIKEVLDTRNASGKDGLRLDIYLKRGTNLKSFISKLRKYTPFESKYSCNFTLLGLDYSTPNLMNLEGIYVTWLTHREQCIKNEIQFNIDKKNEELNKLYGLRIISEDLDTAIKLIRSSKTEKEAIENLIVQFKLNQEQAEYIATIRLVNINQEWISKKIDNIQELERQIIALEDSINNNDEINNMIISQLEDVKKRFGKPRKTEIIYEDEIQDISHEDLVEDFNPTLVLTEQQYIKKNRVFSQSQKLKDDDKILQFHQCNNKDDLLLFTNKGNVLIRKVYELDEHKPSTYGDFLPNLLGEHLENDEKVIYISTTKDYKGSVVSVFENGYIARTDLQTYKPKQNRQIPMDAYNTDSEMVSIQLITNDTDILLVSQEGKALIINISQIRPTKSRNTQGVSGMEIDTKTNKIIGSIIGVTIDDNFNIETKKGKSKFIMLNDIAPNGKQSMTEYLKGNRNTQGNFIYNTRQKNDKVIKLTKQEN